MRNFIQLKFSVYPENRQRLQRDNLTCTILATLRLSLAILSLQSLQEERFDLAYSALNGRSSAMFSSFFTLYERDLIANNLTADWLNFRANSCAAGNGRNVLKKCHACRHAQRQFQGLKSTTVINQACWPRTFSY